MLPDNPVIQTNLFLKISRKEKHMTHAHDKTLLARLGFADPDRREPDHDLACDYLADRVNRLMKIILGNAPGAHSPLICIDDSDTYAFMGQASWDIHCRRIDRETAISKGAGQYRTTIGFMDLSIEYEANLKIKGIRRKISSANTSTSSSFIRGADTWRLWKCGGQEESGEWKINYAWPILGIEVKAQPVPSSEIIRQIRLYREYVRGLQWVAATCFPLTTREIAALNESNIRHVFLGDRFLAWKEAQGSDAAVQVEL